MQTRRFIAGAGLLLMAALAAACAGARPGFDPLTEDPATVDRDNLPGIMEVNFESSGQRLNGLIYLANGPGPHATVVLLHGFPGNEKNLDIAQALRRDGYNVLFFHYRGTWGSEGDFSFSNVVEDVGSATGMLRRRADQYRVDAGRVFLVGHSMGGFAALQGASLDSSIECVAAIAAWDIGVNARAFAADAEEARGFIEYVDSATMLAGVTGSAAVAEITANAGAFSLTGLAPSLAGKRVLLIAGENDRALPPAEHHIPVAAAYSAEAGIDLTTRVIPGDHSFSWTRIQLARELVNWLEGCRDSWSGQAKR